MFSSQRLCDCSFWLGSSKPQWKVNYERPFQKQSVRFLWTPVYLLKDSLTGVAALWQHFWLNLWTLTFCVLIKTWPKDQTGKDLPHSLMFLPESMFVLVWHHTPAGLRGTMAWADHGRCLEWAFIGLWCLCECRRCADVRVRLSRGLMEHLTTRP